MRVRERIDLAFHVMDREYGVTRLLDPEGKTIILLLAKVRKQCQVRLRDTAIPRNLSHSLFSRVCTYFGRPSVFAATTRMR